MAPSTIGTFLRAFTFGHLRQLDVVTGEALRRAWSLGAGPGTETVVFDIDSTITEVHGYQKQGASFGYTKVRGYHPLLATRADTGEVVHARARKGAANPARGTKRFVEELIPRVRRAGATGKIIVRADAGFWAAHNLFRWINLLGHIGDRDRLVVARTLLVRLLSIPARLVHPAGRPRLRMPARWPWAHTFTTTRTSRAHIPPAHAHHTRAGHLTASTPPSRHWSVHPG